MYKFVKRLIDIVISLTGIIVLSWLFLLLALLTLIFNGRPIIFKQPRPGKNGKIFMFYKFRSMSNKKDENGNLLPDAQRLTKFGKFIRLTSIDEIPQLFNILKGDMSLIGPRPRMIEECLFLDEKGKERFKVRPGITGWAQINGRNNITFDKVVQFDKEYVDNMSFKFDVKIFFKTIGYVLKKEDVNKVGTVSNEFYGDYLLRTNQITKEEYAEKMLIAKNMTEALFSKKQKHLVKNKVRKLKLAAEEDYDLESKTID